MHLLPTADRPVWLARDLRQAGLSGTDLRGMRRNGQLEHLRRGAYACSAPPDEQASHLLLVRATLSLLTSDVCVSHTSAALMHGLPWWGSGLSCVHVTRSARGGGRRDPLVHVHPARLEADDRVELDGIAVTSPARTVADCLRMLPFRRAVALGDAALRLGLNRGALDLQLKRAAGRTGVGAARRAAAFIDGRSESVGESYSRVVLHEIGLPPTDLQVLVHEDSGRLVGRCDFGWKESRTLGEFDGKIKYGRLLADGEQPGEVVFGEKVREDRLRDLGNEVVRWTDADLQRPATLQARLVRAFARGEAR